MKAASAFMSILSTLSLAAATLPQSTISTQAPAVRDGQRLYAQSCASCHDAHSTSHKTGPGLKGYYVAHHPPPTDAGVRAIIARGQGTMPAFSSFSQAQMNDLIAYLKTL